MPDIKITLSQEDADILPVGGGTVQEFCQSAIENLANNEHKLQMDRDWETICIFLAQ